MSLDKRIIKGKKPLSYFDSEQGYEFIGKECYFSDIACKYEDLDDIENSDNYVNCTKGTLSSVNIYDKEDRVFENKETAVIYRYCLPCEWVKQTEKKYRPYSLNEFLDEHEIGDKITFRLKLEEQPEDFIRNKVMICGYQIVTGNADTPGEGFVNLGGTLVSLQHMFETYETPNNYLYPEVWKPFGVLDE